jgi:oligopeptidase B
MNCSQKRSYEKSEPPVAKKIPEKNTLHGHTRIDNYHWMEERDNSEVIEYLKAENDYTNKIMAHTETLQETLFGEFSGRVDKSVLSLSRHDGDSLYYFRWEEGKEHPFFIRKRGSPEADEEILIDVNEIAKGHNYTRVPPPTISPEKNLMAFGVYADGRPATLRIKDLASGKLLEDVIYPASANLAWGDDNRTLFYAKVVNMSKGPQQIFRHVLGTDPDQDELVHEETEYRCLVWKRGRYLDAGQLDGSGDLYQHEQGAAPKGR